MGRIHVLSEHVANKIAAGEVVERPASVVKELLENSLDAGATRIRVDVEAGGRKLIQVTDDGCGMVRDDALLAFERHATSKLKNDDDLLTISTLGFRGEALPSIAAVARVRLETRDANEPSGTVVEIAGGRILTVEEAGLPAGTSIAIRDLFFNTPARRKFLKAESTELSHIASLVTHYALAHPEMHWELHSSTNAILVAPPVATHSERIYQVFGRETLDELLPVAAQLPLDRAGLPEPPPWRREPDYQPPTPGDLRLHGFVSANPDLPTHEYKITPAQQLHGVAKPRQACHQYANAGGGDAGEHRAGARYAQRRIHRMAPALIDGGLGDHQEVWSRTDQHRDIDRHDAGKDKYRLGHRCSLRGKMMVTIIRRCRHVALPKKQMIRIDV